MKVIPALILTTALLTGCGVYIGSAPPVSTQAPASPPAESVPAVTTTTASPEASGAQTSNVKSQPSTPPAYCLSQMGANWEIHAPAPSLKVPCGWNIVADKKLPLNYDTGYVWELSWAKPPEEGVGPIIVIVCSLQCQQSAVQETLGYQFIPPPLDGGIHTCAIGKITQPCRGFLAGDPPTAAVFATAAVGNGSEDNEILDSLAAPIPCQKCNGA